MSAANVAENVRRACIEAALAAYEEAKLRGLCHEGAWECAVEAMRSLDTEVLAAGLWGDGAPTGGG